MLSSIFYFPYQKSPNKKLWAKFNPWAHISHLSQFQYPRRSNPCEEDLSSKSEVGRKYVQRRPQWAMSAVSPLLLYYYSYFSVHKFREMKSSSAILPSLPILVFQYSGFDRGHMAAAGNHRQSQEVCDETFLLTNMAPQVRLFCWKEIVKKWFDK